MTRYLVIDVEAKGSNIVRNNMLCFGAAIGDAATGEVTDEFLVFLRQERDDDWEPRCLTEFWDRPNMVATKELILARCAAEGVESAEAMHRFRAWVLDRPAAHLADMIVVTDTAGFDVGFLNYHLGRADPALGMPASMDYLFGGYRPIRDVSSFHMGVARQTPDRGLWGAEAAAAKALGVVIPPNPYTADHLPNNDAKAICWEVMQIHAAIAAHPVADQ